MIDDMLKTKFLISIANDLEAEDFDRLDELHQLAITTEVRNEELTEEIDEIYNKYRKKDIENTYEA